MSPTPVTASPGHMYTLPGTCSAVYIGEHGFVYAHTAPHTDPTVCVTAAAFRVWLQSNYGSWASIPTDSIDRFVVFMFGEAARAACESGIFAHPCQMIGCGATVIYDDEPYCFTHSPDSGSSVRGYSAHRAWAEGEASF